MSDQACTATRSTPRTAASSKASAVAASEAGEPSMPTTTGDAGAGSRPYRLFTTVTGQCA